MINRSMELSARSIECSGHVDVDMNPCMSPAWRPKNSRSVES